MEDILLGTTDRTILVWIADPASTTGAGKTGLAAAAVTVTYTRVETDNDVVHTDVTSSVNDLSALTDAHNDWGWKEVSATLSKGLYRLDLADAVFATGAWYAVVQVTITSGTAAATPKAFRLVARNDLDGVRLGLTALPNAAADAAGGLPISDAGGLDLDAKIGALTFTVAGDVDVNVQTWGGTAISTPPAVNATQISGDGTAADTLELFAEALDQSTGQIDSGTFAAGAINAAAIADAAIDAATFAADVDAEILSYLVDDNTRIDASSLNTATVTTIPAIVADTNELQTDWANGGRLDLLIDATLADTNELQGDWTNGGRLDLIIDAILDDTDLIDDGTSGLAKIATDVAAILVDTAVIGAAGAGLTEAGGTGDHLTAIPWNADWDTQVESEVTDALVAHNLDHLCLTATAGADMTAEVADNTILSRILSNGDTSVFAPSTDGLQPIRDRGDAAWITATGFATSAALTTVGSNVDAIKTKTDNLPSDPADQSAVEAAITAVWTTALTEAYAAAGATVTPAQALYMILQRLTEFAIAGTTVQMKKLDGSTNAFSLTLDSDTAPTSSTRDA